MKTIGCLLLVASLLLVGCADRVPEVSVESESQTVSLPSSGSFEQPFPITGLEGKRGEELLDGHPHIIYYNDSPLEKVLYTPVVMYQKVSGMETLLAYDKATGVFASACRDPLCDHELCLWGSAGNFIYKGKDGLFFLLDREDGQAIYSTDFYGDGGVKRYESTDFLSHLVQEGEYLYFLQEGLSPETGNTVGTVIRLNLKNGETESLVSMEGLCYFMPMGGKLLYAAGEGHRLYDPVTKESTPYGDCHLLPVLLYGEYLYYQKESTLYRRGEYGMGNEELLYEGTLSELLFDGDTVYFYSSENVIYKTTPDFAEVERFYTPETDFRISHVQIHGNLLYYSYTERIGSSRRQFAVMADLATGKTLTVEV